jgi:FemAB-related protein (PEP-CTERM system-associated)
VRLATPADDASRDALVLDAPQATFFHLSGWRRFVERTYRHPACELAAWRGGELVGILPLMRCRGLLGGRKLVSMPYAVYGGPIGVDREVELALVGEAKLMAERQRAAYLELRCLEDPDLDLAASELYFTFLKDLPERPEDVLTSMPKKARAEARKARKRHGLDLAEGVWYVDDLVRLFLQNKHALGSPALPPEHFTNLLEELGQHIHVHLVSKDRKPVAAVMSFAFRDTLIAYYAGTAPGADRAFSASNFMYMALQEWAVEKGFRVFDFCRSRGDSGAFQFKLHQGFEPRPLHYRYHLVGAKGTPWFNPSDPRTAFLRRTWSALPLWLARRLSRSLARRIP